MKSLPRLRPSPKRSTFVSGSVFTFILCIVLPLSAQSFSEDELPLPLSDPANDPATLDEIIAKPDATDDTFANDNTFLSDPTVVETPETSSTLETEPLEAEPLGSEPLSPESLDPKPLNSDDNASANIPEDAAIEDSNIPELSTVLPKPAVNEQKRQQKGIEAYNQGVESYNNGDYSTTIQTLRSIMENDLLVETTDVYNLLARAYTRQAYALESDFSNPNQAKETYRVAIKIFRTLIPPYSQTIKKLYSFAHNRLGSLIYNTEYNPDDDATFPSLQQAFMNFNSAINIDKENSSAYNNKGIAYSVQGDPLPAINSFTKAIEYDRNNVIAYLNRATDHFFIGNLSAALSDFNEVIRYQDLGRMLPNPNEVKIALRYAQEMLGYTHLRLGNTRYHEGRYEESIEHYKSALANSQELGQGSAGLFRLRANIHLYLGTTYAQIRDFQNARGELSQALALNPASAEAYNNLGIVFYSEKKFQDAVDTYSSAIERDPSLAEAYLNRGNAYARLGQSANARADYQTANSLGINFQSSAYQKVDPRSRGRRSLHHVYARTPIKIHSPKKVFLL